MGIPIVDTNKSNNPQDDEVSYHHYHHETHRDPYLYYDVQLFIMYIHITIIMKPHYMCILFIYHEHGPVFSDDQPGQPGHRFSVVLDAGHLG